MVSIKRNLSLFFLKSLFFVSFMALCSAAYAVSCSSSQAPCCSGTTLTCCPHPGYDSSGIELSYDLSACSSFSLDLPLDDAILKPVDGLCTLGDVQYKPDGICGTTSRTCCGLNGWSDWGGECSSSSTKSCSASTKPATSQSCTKAGGGSGTQTRTVTCDTSTGEWTTGSWGTCTCSKTCSGGQVLDSGTCNCCNYGCYIAINKSNYNYACNCIAGNYAYRITCCTMTNGNEFYLPAYYSSCSAFASDMGLNLNASVASHACSKY